jgi:hypothetical protein
MLHKICDDLDMFQENEIIQGNHQRSKA